MASDEQFSLCWNNFHANMSAGFHGLLSRGDLVDVTLAAEGRLLQAHKLVLSVCSPFFQEMFKMNPTQHPIVFLKDVSHSALRDLLQFMYQGEVNVKQEELASFISTAEQLQVKGLTGNQNEESSTPSKPKPTSRPGPRSSQQRQSVMTKLETDLDSKPSSTPVAVKRPNRPSIASNNSSSSQSGGPVKRKCVDPLEAGPSGSAKDEFVTIPDEDENNAVAPKMEPEFVNESMWDDDDDGTNNDETNFGEDDSNMEMSGFDGSATGDGTLTGTGEGAVGDAQGVTRLLETAIAIRTIARNDSDSQPRESSESLKTQGASTQVPNSVLHTILQNQKYMIQKLTSIDSKVDKSFPKNKNPRINTAPLKDISAPDKFVLKPIKNIRDLEELEQLLSDNDYKQQLKTTHSLICTSGLGTGTNCAYRLVDILFARNFMVGCSWSGGSREEYAKIALKNYKNILNFFSEMINHWDSSFTQEDTENFFKTILKNSKKRTTAKYLRASKKKRRPTFAKNKKAIDTSYTNDDIGPEAIYVPVTELLSANNTGFENTEMVSGNEHEVDPSLY